jgi:hypothetical protein
MSSRHGLKGAMRPVQRPRSWVPQCLRPIAREAHIFYLRWALAEIAPMHPDVPQIVLTLRQLLDERYARRCYLRTTWSWL